jgi:hypothetical protein
MNVPNFSDMPASLLIGAVGRTARGRARSRSLPHKPPIPEGVNYGGTDQEASVIHASMRSHQS